MAAMSDGSVSRSQMSSSSLRYGSFQNSLATLTPEAEDKPALSPRSAYVAVAVLCYVNLVNYIERYTIAGPSCFFFICLFLWGRKVGLMQHESFMCFQSNMS